MNIYRLIADLSHLASICILIHRIFSMRSCRGLSLKTQSLYTVVYITRYLDLFTRWVSAYNTFLKLFFILSSCYTIYLIVVKFRPMDEEESTDTFRVEYAIIPCAVLASFINYRFSPTEILWSFSIFLEAVAILPQLHMLRRTGQAEALTRYYIVAFGSYRAFYIPNWIHRYITEGTVDPIAITCGAVQTCINFYFIYEYFKKYPSEVDIESPPDAPASPSADSKIVNPHLQKKPLLPVDNLLPNPYAIMPIISESSPPPAGSHQAYPASAEGIPAVTANVAP